jgi:type 1 glutamine amidotransferase
MIGQRKARRPFQNPALPTGGGHPTETGMLFPRILPLVLTIGALLTSAAWAATPLKGLIVDGQNNHDWWHTTPHLKKLLEETGLFQIDVATSPRKDGDMSTFRPKFSDYAVVITNYNGQPWSDETKASLVTYVRGGGGFVVVHAADNSFPEWKEYNEMIGVGGWGGRSEKSGAWLYWQDKIIRDSTPGKGGSHGERHEYKVVTRAPTHPIMKGLPVEWMHAKDELYDRLRGPAENLTVLATAYSDPATKGTGKHEPLLFTIHYGRGRVFHTAMGHNAGPDLTAQKCAGFIVTLQRGTEWAATGKVTQKVPADFPKADAVSSR